MPFHRGGDNLVVLVIVGVLAYVGVSGYRSAKAQAAARDCLVRLSAAAEGPLPAGAACPVSGKAYSSVEPVRCPEPGTHLPTDPRFVGRRLTQSFPPAGEALAIPDWTRWARLEATAGGLGVTLLPRFWWRYLAGPLLVLIGLFACLLLAANAVIEVGRRPRRPVLLVMYVVALVLVGILTGSVVGSAWGRETWTFDGGAKVVRRQRHVLGMAWGGPTLHADPRALAPVRGSRTVLMLVGRDGRAVELFAVKPEAVGALAPLHETLFPGR